MIVKKVLVTDVKKYDDISLYFSDKCNVGFEIGGYLVYNEGTDDEYEEDEDDMAGKYIGDCLVYIYQPCHLHLLHIHHQYPHYTPNTHQSQNLHYTYH